MITREQLLAWLAETLRGSAILLACAVAAENEKDLNLIVHLHDEFVDHQLAQRPTCS